ncbi:HEPN domain-containing protein [Sedimenticola sp.]|uniref:HEPN domain-containing protein n=1 Tax=Sedimenticola sp. TaxID=1940285 RepID=UPI003D0E1411
MEKKYPTDRFGSDPFGERPLYYHRNGQPIVQHYEEMQGLPSWYKMNTRPKHLPPQKQKELRGIVETIRSHHDVEMIILFGSYARGDWVEDTYEEGGITYTYHSDYDILIVVADKSEERNVEHDNAMREALEPGRDGTKVSYIVHTIHHVNQMLAERRFFFLDILKEGYLLHDSKRFMLARPPKELEPDIMLRISKEYFKEWMESADDFFETSEDTLKKGKVRLAAFLLHQAAERYITCLLLVETGYRPKEHDMERLLKQAAGFDKGFNTVFPRHNKAERHLFDLLRRAYVDARYNKTYRITEQELNTLSKRVQELKAISDRVCRARIEELQNSVT